MGRVKACNACRQLKLRCDAYEYRGSACSRCRRMDRECIMSTSFERKKKQTKSDLRRELDRLYAKYESPLSIIPTTATPTDQTDLTATQPPVWETNEQSFANLPVPDSRLYPSSSTCQHHKSTEQNLSLYSGPTLEPDLSLSTSIKPFSSTTMSRRLGNVDLSPRKIDGCFFMFAQHYAPALAGIYDPTKTPNDVFEYSHFLFWVIVYAGARKYSKDPMIIASLPKPLSELARQSIFDIENAIPTVQAIIILSLWPLPVQSPFKDQIHVLTGAAMQLAIQKGLPYTSRRQDFFNRALKESEPDTLFPSRLWAYCVKAFQSASLYDGLPSPLMMDFKKLDWNESIFTALPNIVLYEHRLHRVLKEATASVMKTVDLGSNTDSCVLNSLVDYFDQQAQGVASKEAGDLYDFALNSVRLMIRAFHFFSTPSAKRDSEILKTYFISCNLIENASRLDKSQAFGSHFSHFQARSLVIAAICILRLCRSSLRAHVDTEISEEMFFEVVRLSRKTSVDKNDLHAIMANIFTQIWSSTQVFKFKDGSVDGLRLLLRGRLSMSLLFDCLWWWRAEFLGKTSPYLERESRVNTPTRQEKDDISSEQLPTDPQNLITSDMALYPDFWNWEELNCLDWN